MLSQLKSFLNKFSRKTSEAATPEVAPIPMPDVAPKAPTPARPATAPAPARPAAPAAVAPAPSATASPNAGPDEIINLPIKIVLSRLTPALTALVKAPGDGTIALSTRKVLEQLPKGSVKLSFAELRQAAPAGTFLDVTSQDQNLVELPLPEILSRISPEHLKRKPAQRQIEVPAEVGNVFGPRGEQLPQPTSDTGTLRKPAAPPQARPAAAPQPVKPAPAPKVATTIPVPAAKIPAPKPEPAPAAAPVPTDRTQFFLKKEAVPAGEALTIPLVSVSDGWPQNIKEEIASQNLADSSVALPMSRVEAALKTGKILFSWNEIGSWLKPNPFVSQLNAETPLELPLKVVAPLFISQHRPVMPQKKVDVGESIPDIFSGAKMKAGAPVAEPPAAVPAPAPTPAPAPAAAPIPAAPAPVAMPAAAPVAPPKPPTPTPAAPGTPSSIPAVGLPKPPTPVPATGLPKPPLPPPPAVKPTPTSPSLPKVPTPPLPKAAPTAVPLPKPVPAAAPATAAAVEYKSLGELFGDTAKTDWSPKDIVQATNKLKGVAGSMVSLSDGLMVAGELPAPFRAETTAAFLPQIFGRMAQYAKELHLGDMNVISFECQKAPLIIYKSGMVFFGVLGRAGEQLPLAQIRFIAAELAKQNK